MALPEIVQAAEFQAAASVCKPCHLLMVRWGDGHMCLNCDATTPCASEPPRIQMNPADLVAGLAMLDHAPTLDPTPIRWRAVAASLAGLLALIALLGALAMWTGAGGR